mgnify:FL=1|tara:strand:- start:405 stop:641 length:237 start_codon:yes stop_codon:yes gene_type:complete
MSNIENDTTYHIYAKDRCLYYNLKKKEFEEKWDMLNKMVGLMKTDYVQEDLNFELVTGYSGKYIKNNSSSQPAGGDSY